MSDTDEALYRRYQAEDNAADLEALLARHRDGLLLFLFSFVHSNEDAEELLMDTFAKLAADKPSFHPRHAGSFKSWLYAIGRNNALMMIRRGKVKAVPLHEGVPAGGDLPETALLKDESNRLLYQAMEALKPEYRRALTLLYFDGLSHDEIALAMGLRKGQVYSMLKHGKETLKKTLERMGISDAQY